MPDFTSVFTQERDHWQARAEAAEAELERERARAREHIDARCRAEGRSEAWQMKADGWRQRATRAEAEVERLRCEVSDRDEVNEDLRKTVRNRRAEVERLRGALGECVTFWRERYNEGAPHEYGDYNTALGDCICNIEAVLRGDQ